MRLVLRRCGGYGTVSACWGFTPAPWLATMGCTRNPPVGEEARSPSPGATWMRGRRYLLASGSSPESKRLSE